MLYRWIIFYWKIIQNATNIRLRIEEDDDQWSRQVSNDRNDTLVSAAMKVTVVLKATQDKRLSIITQADTTPIAKRLTIVFCILCSKKLIFEFFKPYQVSSLQLHRVRVSLNPQVAFLALWLNTSRWVFRVARRARHSKRQKLHFPDAMRWKMEFLAWTFEIFLAKPRCGMRCVPQRILK